MRMPAKPPGTSAEAWSLYLAALEELRVKVGDRELASMEPDLRGVYLPQLEAKVRQSPQRKARATRQRCIPGFSGLLREDQAEDVALMEADPKAILANDQGTGKTVTTLALLQKTQSFPVIVACKKDLMYQWLRKARQFLPLRSLTLLDRTEKRAFQLRGEDGLSFDVPLFRMAADIHVCPETQVYDHLEGLQKVGYKALVIDESHRLRNPEAKASYAALELSLEIPRVHQLSATPAPHKLDNLRHQLAIAGKDVSLLDGGDGSPSSFVQIGRRLRANGVVRRTKQEVLPDLAPKQRYTLNSPLSALVTLQYKQAERDFALYLEQVARRELRFLSTLSHLSEERALSKWEEYAKREMSALGNAKSVQALLEKVREGKGRTRALQGALQQLVKRAQQDEGLRRYQHLRSLAAKGKAEFVTGWLRRFFLQTDRKIVLYCMHREVAEGYAGEFPGMAVLRHGGMNSRKRDAAVEAFVHDPTVRLLVITYGVGKEGLDGLQKAASDVAFAELDWSATDTDQAEDRLHRDGQQAGRVDAWYFLTKNTVDEDVAALVEDKRVLHRSLFDLDPNADNHGRIGFSSEKSKHTAFGRFVQRTLNNKEAAVWLPKAA